MFGVLNGFEMFLHVPSELNIGLNENYFSKDNHLSAELG